MHTACFHNKVKVDLDKTDMTEEEWEADSNILLWCVACESNCFVCNLEKSKLKKKKKNKTQNV